jgi:hypothetical protein
MPISNPWIVCEKSGRWTAALRVALSREKSITLTPRFLQVRSLAELDAAMNQRGAPVGLVEVRPDNLGAALEMFAKSTPQNFPFIALLDDTLAGHQVVTDALWEAGAAEVVDSPRRMRPVMKFAELAAAVRVKLPARAIEVKSIAEKAWAALPWQDS